VYIKNLDSIIAACAGKKIAVLGDLMLDRYVWGNVDRISPEAPVPVVSVERRSHSLGGSANVVNNISALGGQAIPLGVVGADPESDLVFGLMRSQNINTDMIIRDDERPTTQKTRIIANDQHIVRIDEEMVDPIRKTTRLALLERYEKMLPELDAVIFQDYDKGVLVPEFISVARDMAAKQGVLTAVDPKLNNFHHFTEMDIFKPNQKEICNALGCTVQLEGDIEKIGRRFLEQSACRELLITRGADGMACFDKNGNFSELPALQNAIVDVSGAGDTVIAALILAVTQGLGLADAAGFASLCAAEACANLGAVPVHPNKLRKLNEWIS
jgi:D-glycero-beta-D-manno-heptose-7-phosphate kinase